MDRMQGDLKPESPQDFAKRHALPFKDVLLLSRALTHRSYLNEHPEALEDNERLEFLGDAVLDFVVGAWLYNRFPEMSEGDLTRLRAALVRTEQLAEFGWQIEIGGALRLGRGEEEGGGRKRTAMLCATFEAVIGALYLDVDIAAVEDFIAQFLEEAAEIILQDQRDRDAKSQLQEWAQGQGYAIPQYRVVDEEGPDHAKTFTMEVYVNGSVLGTGMGHSKQEASKVAAKNALISLNL
ncbi:ribonuclease III [Chloroflexota bacterium]